uniref:Uncharacterized protein n=1 Tax=Arundo donax TaxID=35708 RepID=A0A0A9QTL0_ARUDO
MAKDPMSLSCAAVDHAKFVITSSYLLDEEIHQFAFNTLMPKHQLTFRNENESFQFTAKAADSEVVQLIARCYLSMIYLTCSMVGRPAQKPIT